MKRQEKQKGFPGERLVVVPRPVVTMAMQQPLLKHLLHGCGLLSPGPGP